MTIKEYERIQHRLTQLMSDKKVKNIRFQSTNYIDGYKEAIQAVKSMFSSEFKKEK